MLQHDLTRKYSISQKSFDSSEISRIISLQAFSDCPSLKAICSLYLEPSSLLNEDFDLVGLIHAASSEVSEFTVSV